MSLMEERDFVRYWFKLIKEENEQEGILFPFLMTKNLKENKIIRAKLIPSSKLYRVCFACLSYQAPGASKPKSPYNGVFFSPNVEELEKEGLVEIVHYRIYADVDMFKEDLDGGEYRLYLRVVPDETALENFFFEMGAIYVNSKKMLEAEVELPF